MQMRKVWVAVVLMVVSLSTNLPVQAATNDIRVIYNGYKLNLDKGAVFYNGKIIIPARVLSEYMGFKVRYEKQEKMVYISKENVGEIDFEVIKADGQERYGRYAILMDNIVYLSTRDISNYFNKEVTWESKTKTLTMYSRVRLYDEVTNIYDGLSYDTDTGDFYDEEEWITNLTFKHLTWPTGTKKITKNNHVIYEVNNCYGKYNSNDQMYSVYVVNGKTYVAESFKCNKSAEKERAETYWYETPRNNSLIQDNKVLLANKNIISIYDDVTGNLIRDYTISTEPLKKYIDSLPKEDYLYEDTSKGYMIEGSGDQIVLYRNCLLMTLTLVNLKDDTEVELYKKVYSKSEQKELEASIRENGDGLEFVKAEKGIVYLKNVYTEKLYTYTY